MKKIPLACLFFSITTFADIPHILPAINCPSGYYCCPKALICDYSEGCGPSPHWEITGSPSSYKGLKEYDIKNIIASGLIQNENYYTNFNCEYTSDDNSSLTATFLLSGMGFRLYGNWLYSFMKETATCGIPTDPSTCYFGG